VRIAATLQRIRWLSRPVPVGQVWSALALTSVALICTAIGIWLIITGPTRANAGVDRVIAPGVQEIVLESAGQYTVYHEYHSRLDRQTYRTSSVMPPVVITVSDVRTNALLRLRPPTAEAYDYSTYAGIPVFAFEIDAPGRVRITVMESSGRASPFVMAIADHPIRNPLRELLPGLAGVALSILIAFRAILEWRARQPPT
jgi:hypothetical protein